MRFNFYERATLISLIRTRRRSETLIWFVKINGRNLSSIGNNGAAIGLPFQIGFFCRAGKNFSWSSCILHTALEMSSSLLHFRL